MNTEQKSRFKTARRILIFWTLFIGTGAVAGAVEMLIDPTGRAMGMDAMLPYFKVLPFSDILFKDFIFSGVALLIVNGLTNLTAFALIIAKRRLGIALGGIFGITLMLWICIQFYMFPLNFMSTAYFIFGALQAVTGYAAAVFYKQENFCVSKSDYPDIGTNGERLVVFFSRMGYVKNLAFEEANRTGADIYEIRSTERTAGTFGFWWCGRYGMHRWDMPIEPVTVDLAAYKHITICSPIWVFELSPPVRAFCRQTAGKIKSVDCILVHYQKRDYKNAAREIESILGVKCKSIRSVLCRTGKYKTVYEYSDSGKVLPQKVGSEL